MKQDRKRLSKEKHEIAYVRKLARERLALIRLAEELGRFSDEPKHLLKEQDIRLCKAVLKFVRYKK